VDIPAVTDDYDGQARSALTPVDIGADAGDYAALHVPIINYTPLADVAGLDAPTLADVTITVPGGVNIAPGTRPRLYYKRSTDADTFNDNTSATDGWKWVEAEGTGGSPFSFTLDYARLNGGAASGGETIQYFVVAQSLDATPVVGLSAGVFAGQPASVALTAAAFPLVGPVDSYHIRLSGTVTVCPSGCDYASLTLAGGLFAAINTYGLGGDLIAEIRGDLTAETGANSLNQWTDQGGGPWTLTIQPAGGAARIISGTAGCLIYLNGADRVTIDGLNSGGNTLLIRGRGAAIGFINDASQNTVRNCTIEGKTPLLGGVVSFGRGAVTGNDDNTIANNVIRDRSDVTAVPYNLIYSSDDLSGKSNSGNIVRDNTLKNFERVGILLQNSNGNADWTISGNTIFQEATRTLAMYGINFSAQGTNTITGNTIRDLMGRSAIGICLGDAGGTTVSGNRITLATAGSTYAWSGIVVGSGSTTSAVTLTNNLITLIPSTSASQPLYGISDYAYSGSTLNVYHNSVYIGGTATGSTTWAFLRTTYKADTVTLKNNIFFNGRTGGSVNHFAAGNQSASGTFTSDYNLFAGTGTTTPASFMDWGTSSSGTPVDFATWQTSSGGDSHSYADLAANIPAASLFTDAASGDLSIMTGSGFEAPPLPSDRGVSGLGVTDDYSGTLRSTTLPDLGAFEFDVNRTGLAGPDTLAGGWGYYDTLGIDSGAVTAGADVNAVDLTMAAGATLDMDSFNLNVAGSGNAISSQQDVTGNTDFTFLGPTGVVINPGDSLPLGQTDVAIRFLGADTTSCVSGGETTVRRCFQINPTNTTGRNATVRFYFDETRDLNGLTCANLKAYHNDGSTWSLAGGTGGTPTCTGGISYVEVTGVTTFSDFVLGNENPSGGPTAVRLSDFTARPAGVPYAWPVVVGLVGVAIGAVAVGARRRRW
jgi:hypothetical protein